MTRFALLIEGRVLETIPECGARCGVLRLRLVTAPREVRDTARQALYDLAARSSLYGLRRKCCRRKRGPRPQIATVERREASVPSAQGARRTRRCDNQRQCACRRSATPRGEDLGFKTRAQSRRGNELGCLTSEDVNIATAHGAARWLAH